MKSIALYLISDGFGGAEQVVWQTINGLKDQINIYLIVNNEVACYYKNLLPPDQILNIGDIYLHLNQKYRYIRYLLNNRYYSFKPLLVITKTNKIVNFLATNRIRTVHAHLEFALFSLNRIKKIDYNLNIIYTIHSAFGLLSDKSLRPQISLRNINFSIVDIFIFVSKSIYKLYKENNITIGCNYIIYNGVDLSKIHNINMINSVKPLFKILYVGGAKPVKGYDVLVNTAKILLTEYKLENFQVLVLGNVPPKCEFIKLIKHHRLTNKFSFRGYIKPPLHLDYFRQAHILFMPSRTEAMPMAAIEALLLCLPIVASNVGGLPEIVKNGENGYLCAQDPNEFASKIYALNNSFSLFKSQTINYNSIKKKRFDVKNFCNRQLELYNSFN